MALIDDLAARLKETTDELEAEIGSRYPGVGRHAYANEQRRFERDMASVRAARHLLDLYEAAGGNTNGKMPVDQAQKIASKSFPDYRNGLPIPGEWRDAPLTVIQQPADYVPFVKPAGAPSHKFDALLCELGALGVRLDVLRGQ